MVDGKDKQKWYALLQCGSAFCYFKPTRYKHDSGFRCIEIGYCTLKGNKIDEKLILGQCSDVIDSNKLWHNDKRTVFIDLTLDGYFRILSRDHEKVWWGSLDFVVSSTYICKLGEDYL